MSTWKFRESGFLMTFTQGSAPPPGSLYKGLRVSDQPSASLLSPGRVRRNSAGDEVAPGGRHQEHQEHHQHHQQHNTSKSNGHNNNSLDVSGNESHELSYGDLQYSTHSESTVRVGENDDDNDGNDGNDENDDSHNMDDFSLSLRKQ